MNGLSDKYNELQRDIAGLAIGQANQLARFNECCCETKQAIAQANYDAAMRDAATNANFTSQIQGLKDMIKDDKMEAMQNRINQLELQNQPKLPPMELKMIGIIWKTRFGPWSIGMPTEKSAGKMTSPDRRAIPVSSVTMIKLLVRIFLSASR